MLLMENPIANQINITMKRPLLLAALLAAPLALGTPIKAEETGTGSYGSGSTAPSTQMFNILSNTAGQVIFSGTGSAQFNNSVGSTNNFNVGSSTNLGVNASTSSTPEYDGTSTANLNLAAGSTLMQTIGTATSAANTQAASSAAASAASTAAYEAANSSSYGSTYSNDWAVSNKSSWDAENKYTYDNDFGGWYKWSGTGESAQKVNANSEVKVSSSSSWQTGWENKYQQSYNNAYSVATSSNSSTANSETQTGVISGKFVTSESGSANQSANATQVEAAAKSSAISAMGYENYIEYKAANWDATTGWKASAEYKTESSYESAYQNAYASGVTAAAAAAGRQTVSNVEVTGIGSIANAVAASGSNFVVDLTNINSDPGQTIGDRGQTATASGSAGSQLSTSSFANQSAQTTASAFMQAFKSGS